MKVLDPFGGIGSTAKACEITERVCTSIELFQMAQTFNKDLELEVCDGASKTHTLSTEILD